MIKPSSYQIDFYKGVDFSFSFRLKSDGSYIDLSAYTIRFNASTTAEGANILTYSSADSPTVFSFDSSKNNLVTMLIPQETISALTDSELFYTLDLEDASSLNQRYLFGKVIIYGDAE